MIPAQVSMIPAQVSCLKQKAPDFRQVLSGAAARIRTGDLILTNDALYLLSYSSIAFPTAFAVGSGDREGT